MADYYPLIAKAVAGLDKSTGEARRALYDRARTALLAQLRGVEPALSEPDITHERLALEEAIRKVEAEAARRARGELTQEFVESSPGYGSRATRSSIAAAEDDGDDDRAEAEETRQALPLSAAAASARAPDSQARRSERWSSGPSLRGFPDSLGENDSLEDRAVRASPLAERDFGRFEPSPGRWTERDEAGLSQARGLEHSPLPRLSSRDAAHPPAARQDQDDGRGRGLQSFPRIVRPERAQPSERVAPERPQWSAWSAPRNTNRAVAIAVIGLLASGIAGVAYWFGDDILSSIRGASGRAGDQIAPAEASHGSSKITERAPSALGPSESSTAAQKVVLYEEDPANPNGTQFVGTATWHTERVSPGAGQKPEVVIRGDIEIPEQRVSVRLSLHRNDDKQLPASHTVEIMFKLPPDFPHGGISTIPGIMVKQGETTRGIALNGVAVKVTDNFFLVGLSSADAEMQRNVQLLKERSWFDIPLVYSDNKRALIAIEKGAPGERAFADAFAAWEQP